jgi:hypothetical protein
MLLDLVSCTFYTTNNWKYDSPHETHYKMELNNKYPITADARDFSQNSPDSYINVS